MQPTSRFSLAAASVLLAAATHPSPLAASDAIGGATDAPEVVDSAPVHRRVIGSDLDLAAMRARVLAEGALGRNQALGPVAISTDPGLLPADDAEAGPMPGGPAPTCTLPAAPAACPVYSAFVEVGPGRTYATIQAAINAITSTRGTTIRVYPKTAAPFVYQENLTVNKLVTILGMVSSNAEHNVTLETLAGASTGVTISTSNACVTRLRINHLGSGPAVLFNGTSTAQITGAKLVDDVIDLSQAVGAQTGVQLRGSVSGVLRNNAIIGSSDATGIHFESDLGNTTNHVWDNVISGFSTGIVMNSGTFYGYNRPMSFNNFVNNRIRQCGDAIWGWSMDLGSWRTVVSDNLFHGNWMTDSIGVQGIGMMLLGTTNDRVCNSFLSGYWAGVYLDSASNLGSSAAYVKDNHIRGSEYGIAVGYSSANQLLNNSISTQRTNDPLSHIAAITFFSSPGPQTVSQGELFSNDCGVGFQLPVPPGFTRPIVPDSINNQAELCFYNP